MAEPIPYEPFIKQVPEESIDTQKVKETRPDIVLRALENSDTNAGGTTIYTVPEGKMFFLLTAELNFRNGVTSPSSATAELSLISSQPSGEGFILMLDPPDVALIFDSVAVSPTIPIRLLPNDRIVVKSDDDHTFARGVITGYEVHSKKIELFLSDFI